MHDLCPFDLVEVVIAQIVTYHYIFRNVFYLLFEARC